MRGGSDIRVQVAAICEITSGAGMESVGAQQKGSLQRCREALTRSGRLDVASDADPVSRAQDQYRPCILGGSVELDERWSTRDWNLRVTDDHVNCESEAHVAETLRFV